MLSGDINGKGIQKSGDICVCVAVWRVFTVSQPAALSGALWIPGPSGLCSSPFKLENRGSPGAYWMGNSCAHAGCGTVRLKAHGGSCLRLGESWPGDWLTALRHLILPVSFSNVTLHHHCPYSLTHVTPFSEKFSVPSIHNRMLALKMKFLVVP